MSSQKPVAIIILNWNDFLRTIKCTESVLVTASQFHEQFHEIIIVDNGSDDESPIQLKLFVEDLNKSGKLGSNIKVTLLENNANLGYAGGNNVGIKHALDNQAEYVLILNNDTVIETDSVYEMIKKAESDNQTGIVGARISEQRSNTQEQIILGGLLKWFKPELSHIPRSPNHLLPVTNYFISGSAILVKRGVFSKIGLLDEKYFLYFEDADFNLRAQKAGFRIRVAEKAKIVHEVSATSRTLGSPIILYYHFRNALYFNKKLGPGWVKILVYPWSLWILTKQITKLIIGINREATGMIIKGVLDFYKNKMGKINTVPST